MGKLLEGGSRTCRQSFRRSYSFCCSSAGEQCGRSWAVVDYVIEQDMDRGYFLSWEWPGASTIELAELRQPRSEGGWNEMTFFRNNGKWLVIALIALLLYRFFSDSHTSHPQSIGSSPLVSQEAKDPVMTCMIQRNTTVPTLKSKFFTAAPQQEGVLIQVLEGELPLAKDNHTVGQLHLDKLRPAFADRVLIEVSFDIDVPERIQKKMRMHGVPMVSNCWWKESRGHSVWLLLAGQWYDRQKEILVDVHWQLTSGLYLNMRW